MAKATTPAATTPAATEGNNSVAAEKELKRIFIPKLPGSKNQPPMEGSVNGKSFLLPRNQWVELPDDIYEVVKRSLDAEDKADDYYSNVQKELIARSRAEETLQ